MIETFEVSENVFCNDGRKEMRNGSSVLFFTTLLVNAKLSAVRGGEGKEKRKEQKSKIIDVWFETGMGWWKT